MTIRGSVPYEVTTSTAELFSAPGTILTLINSGPNDVYLSTRDGQDVSGHIVLHVSASLPWDADKPCFARTLTGRATVAATDNSGVITDPSAIATAILDQGLALDIANAVLGSGLDVSIADAIIAQGLPQLVAQFEASTPPQAEHVVQLVQVNHAVGAANTFGDFDTYYYDGVQHVYPETFTADPAKGFRVMKSMVSFKNPTGADIRVSYFCQRDVTHPLHTFALNTVNVPAGGTSTLVIDYDGATTDSFVLGGTGAFIPKWGLFASAAGLVADVSYLCATFAGAELPAGVPSTPPTLPTYYSSNGTTWATGSQAAAKFINLPVMTEPGDLVVVAMAFTKDDIPTVSGLGNANWSSVKSRDAVGSGFPSAYIFWTEVVTAGTNITLTPNPNFQIEAGTARAYHFRGVDAVLASSANQTSAVGTATPQTQPLNAVVGQLYVGVSCVVGAAAPVSTTDQPGPWDQELDQDASGGGLSWFNGGFRIAQGPETISRTCTYGGGHPTIQAAAVFGTPV